MHVNNKGIFSATGEYDGQTHEGISVCFVIRHPKGTLLWNSGVGDEVATKAGTVVLSGDLYHLRDNRRYHRVPGGNFSRADTLASFNRIDTIVKNTHARFIIEHDRADFVTLPKFPAYLD